MCSPCSFAVSTVLVVTVLLLTHAEAIVQRNQECDLYEGRWVFDKSYPQYDSEKCPLILQQFNCMKNGRPDLHYQNYRWQPNNCNLPRWDGKDFINKVKGKRIMFVGDSISMNQFQSLGCMILSAYPRPPYKPAKSGPLSTITFPTLNLTLMYMRNAYIVDISIKKATRVLRLNSVADSANQWLRSDILIFNTWHWWIYTGNKQPWDWIQDGKVMRKDMDRLEAYEKALRTWTKWVEQNVDTKKVKIFFQGVSPDHWNASEWGRPEAQRCGGQQQPLDQPVGGRRTNRAENILKRVLKGTRKPVKLLDIHKLSEYRVDGHPSVYGNPRRIGMDCTHWCLPGVPDTWNLFLYAAL